MQGGDRVMDKLTKLYTLSLIINVSEKLCMFAGALMVIFGAIFFVEKDVLSFNITMINAIICTITGIIRLVDMRVFLRIFFKKKEDK